MSMKNLVLKSLEAFAIIRYNRQTRIRINKKKSQIKVQSRDRAIRKHTHP